MSTVGYGDVSPGYKAECDIYDQNKQTDQCLYFIFKGEIQLYSKTYHTKQQQDFIEENHYLGLNQNTLEFKLGCLKEGQVLGFRSFFTQQPKTIGAKSTNISQIIILKREDFIQVLKNYPNDYDIFCSRRDHMLQNQIQIDCIICQQEGHISENCPRVLPTFQIRRNKYINNYLHKQYEEYRETKAQRREFQRKCKFILYKLFQKKDLNSNLSSNKCEQNKKSLTQNQEIKKEVSTSLKQFRQDYVRFQQQNMYNSKNSQNFLDNFNGYLNKVNNNLYDYDLDDLNQVDFTSSSLKFDDELNIQQYGKFFINQEERYMQEASCSQVDQGEIDFDFYNNIQVIKLQLDEMNNPAIFSFIKQYNIHINFKDFDISQDFRTYEISNIRQSHIVNDLQIQQNQSFQGKFLAKESQYYKGEQIHFIMMKNRKIIEGLKKIYQNDLLPEKNREFINLSPEVQFYLEEFVFKFNKSDFMELLIPKKFQKKEQVFATILNSKRPSIRKQNHKSLIFNSTVDIKKFNQNLKLRGTQKF
ncbi:Cyclic nucleotide-binding protein [Pseudocohnilembus persalinus]|uniref:Cyclic nucleotide-binding protein n=1 Tax=Pseudocohnilembus persalinus TaxID=266149 RepID=A0A0V0QS47_PSEPJ|nr:Cyclic nucleotide-binding protein [Pseudocohnilembus persalinus]|eukprot:KRX04810.1 Cyclic nucleotide-binding protein [Pseudocohnilembus persalinus]